MSVSQAYAEWRVARDRLESADVFEPSDADRFEDVDRALRNLAAEPILTLVDIHMVLEAALDDIELPDPRCHMALDALSRLRALGLSVQK